MNFWPAAGAGSAQRSARAPSGAVAKRLDVILRSSTSSTVPISTTLPSKWRRKKSLSSFSAQALQIGEREGRDVVGAAREVERDRVGHRARGRELCGAPVPPVARAASSAAIDGYRLAIDHEDERHATDHAVGIVVGVERADVASEADRGALAGRGQHRIVLMLDLAEHDLAGAGAERERAQIVAVEAAQPRAQGLVAERHRGLLDRGREHDVEAHDLGAAVDDRGQHPADLGRPGDARAAFERRGPEGLLIERDHDRGRGRRLVRVAERVPAQHGQQVDREAAQPVERGRGGEEGCAERNQTGLPRPRAGEPDPWTRRPERPLLEAQQAADDRRRAGLGLGVDLERHLVAADARVIDRAAGQSLTLILARS